MWLQRVRHDCSNCARMHARYTLGICARLPSLRPHEDENVRNSPSFLRRSCPSPAHFVLRLHQITPVVQPQPLPLHLPCLSQERPSLQPWFVQVLLATFTNTPQHPTILKIPPHSLDLSVGVTPSRKPLGSPSRTYPSQLGPGPPFSEPFPPVSCVAPLPPHLAE